VGEPQEAQNAALGRAFRTLREKAGLSEEELAERAELPRAELRRVETGEVEANWGTLRHLAYGLGTSLAEVFRLADFDHAKEQEQDQRDHGGDQ
jgi:transcriptional regulator with XRE-family HTH domain